MNSESRSVPGTTTPPTPITWSLMTLSQVAPLCRRPKHRGFEPAYRVCTGTVKQTPSAEATRPPPQARTTSSLVWASISFALAAERGLGPYVSLVDVWLDSVNAAWRAAAAWGATAGLRHVVVPRVHLLTVRRIDQLLAWRELAGAQLKLLWQAGPCGLPPA